MDISMSLTEYLDLKARAESAPIAERVELSVMVKKVAELEKELLELDWAVFFNSSAEIEKRITDRTPEMCARRAVEDIQRRAISRHFERTRLKRECGKAG